MREGGIKELFERIILDNPDAQTFFWGFDMDAVKATDAPGVSAPNPSGLIAGEALMVASIAGRYKRSTVLEVTEVNPALDIDHRTARLAAMIIQMFLNNINQWKE